ncbi:MAG TPA: beta-galactosidase [Bryobacteraceae bacterium]|nr:beta-galactosidase [Bryobacteraceae bacterium]
MTARTVVLGALWCAALFAQAPQLDTVLYGASYYHEYMPYERLEKDVDLMQKAGITVIRLGESTWSSWEPRDGEFQFAWMERILDRLHKAGIKVILGTPTYSIPTWLYKKHPDILVTHFGQAPPLSDPYSQSYPNSIPPGAYGPRQNMDLTHPEYRKHAERVIRAVVGHFKDHPAIIGFQVDNETGPNGLPLPNVQAQFMARLKAKYETPQALNKLWGFAYWGQLVDKWEDFPSRDGILNPGYKLEWERFQQDIVTEFLAWQAKIVREYKRPDQFVTHNFVGGIRTNLDQWAIARDLDVVAVNPYHATQDRLTAREIWLSGDLSRSLKGKSYLVTETNAQTIGWDSRAQYPPYPGQLRLSAYAHLAAGANMVAYWHWHSIHYGQETYWRGVLSHDLEPNRAYGEVSKIGAELKALGPRLANLKKSNQVAILYSGDSYQAIRFMPYSDRSDYMSVLGQMYDTLYQLNVEPDFVPATQEDLSAYKVVVVPPLYSASDAVLKRLADYVKSGGHVVMTFKSGFANEHSTVRWEMAPGPLRAATGFRYQEFTSLPENLKLTPDPYALGDRNYGSVWAEFLIPETAEVVASYDHPYWKFPAITRNKYGNGTLTYEGTVVSAELQRAVLMDTLKRARLSGPDQELPEGVKVRHGRNAQGTLLHYYLNFTAKPQSVKYPYGAGSDLLTKAAAAAGKPLALEPWGVAIIAERGADREPAR